MEIDYIHLENQQSIELFNLHEIIKFQSENKVEVIMQSDFQFYCFINYKEGDSSYAESLTFMNALIMGIKNYKEKNG